MNRKNKKLLNIYYAHSMQIYNTEREYEELAFLKKTFGKVINPKTDILWDDTKGMQPYFDAVIETDATVFSEFQEHIGRGVYGELRTAISHFKYIYCLRKHDDEYKLSLLDKLELVDINDWKIRYGKVSVIEFSECKGGCHWDIIHIHKEELCNTYCCKCCPESSKPICAGNPNIWERLSNINEQIKKTEENKNGKQNS